MHPLRTVAHALFFEEIAALCVTLVVEECFLETIAAQGFILLLLAEHHLLLVIHGHISDYRTHFLSFARGRQGDGVFGYNVCPHWFIKILVANSN